MNTFNREQMVAASLRAATEALNRERARCLWILERLVQQAGQGIDNKLIPAAELQLVKTRFELTKAICTAASTLIRTGIAPKAPPSEIVT